MAYVVDHNPYLDYPYRGSTGPTGISPVNTHDVWLPIDEGRLLLDRMTSLAALRVRAEESEPEQWFVRAYWYEAGQRYDALVPRFDTEADAKAWIDAVLLGVGDPRKGYPPPPNHPPFAPAVWLVPRDPEEIMRFTRPEEPEPEKEPLPHE